MEYVKRWEIESFSPECPAIISRGVWLPSSLHEPTSCQRTISGYQDEARREVGSSSRSEKLDTCTFNILRKFCRLRLDRAFSLLPQCLWTS